MNECLVFKKKKKTLGLYYNCICIYRTKYSTLNFLPKKNLPLKSNYIYINLYMKLYILPLKQIIMC